MDSKTFLIPSMMAGDDEIVQTELGQIAGVREVRVEPATRSVTITWAEPATWSDIHKRLLELNFTPDLPQPY